MFQSKIFSKTLKTPPKEAELASHKLLVRADFISQLASGVYSYLPLGLMVERKAENIIREELNSIGSQEVFLPALQPKEIWVKTGRWEKMDPPLFKIKDRHDREFALGSTHEEVICELAKNRISSYRDLPQALYQIQTKFRNEMRFTGGLLRAREFLMKDLYSFHSDVSDLELFFTKVLAAYDKIFKRCQVPAIRSEASGGVFTKEKTYEFQMVSEAGEDRIFVCENCGWSANFEVLGNQKLVCPNCKKTVVEKRSIELGHTFRLGAKYSAAFDISFLDKQGKKNLVVMGCYGIGVGRLISSVVEAHHDEKGIVWPLSLAPFQIHLIQIENSPKISKACEKIYSDFQKEGWEVLYDDRSDRTAGEKFADSDLIGLPYRILISQRSLEKDSAEIKKRSEKEGKLVKLKSLLKYAKTEFTK